MVRFIRCIDRLGLMPFAGKSNRSKAHATLNRTVGSVILMLVGVFATFSVLAASSYSSTSYTTDPKASIGQMIPYRDARLFTENDSEFYIRAFGCEYRLSNDISSGGALDNFVLEKRKVFKSLGNQLDEFMNGTEFLYTTRLVDSRPYNLSALRSEVFKCDTEKTLSTITIMKRANLMDRGRPPRFAIWINQHPMTKLLNSNRNTTQFGTANPIFFTLEPDQMTPNQERKALEAATEIGIAVLKALSK
jgi:hypothetical protein